MLDQLREMVLVRAGLACHGRWEGGEARYAHRKHWLPELPWEPPSAQQANTLLARRYFHGYGPATLTDFAYWRGVSVAQARGWVEALADEMVEVDAVGSRALAFAADLPEMTAAPPAPEAWLVRMLGRFDPLLLAHKCKDWVGPEKRCARVWRPAGHIEATVLEHGRAVGTWRYDRIGVGGLAVTVHPFGRGLSAQTRKEVKRLAIAVGRFFGAKAVELRMEKAPAMGGGHPRMKGAAESMARREI